MGPILEIRLRDVLHAARACSASDVHLVAGERPALRVDGFLRFVESAAFRAGELAAVCAFMCGDDVVNGVEAGDDVTRAWEYGGDRWRLHAYRASGGVALAMRLLPANIPTFSELGLPPIVETIARADSGLVIFSGPTGCGKSTSLAACVEHINATRARRIVAIEDPIEFRYVPKTCSIVQREVGADTPSFHQALLGALRCDPDVIVLGEMRDSASMTAALSAAETGHLVVTTLHTGTASGTIERIVDTFSGEMRAYVRSQLAHVLRAVICQRLYPRAGGSGRKLAAEVLLVNDAVRAIVRDGRTHQLRNAIATGRTEGMQTIEDHLASLIGAGEVDARAEAAVR